MLVIEMVAPLEFMGRWSALQCFILDVKRPFTFWIFCKVGALGSMCVCVIALVNIALLLWNISPLKCLSVLVLLAGVEAVRCTLCSTREIQEAPGHIITWYFTIYDTWRKMPGMIAKCGPSMKLNPERDKCLSCIFAFGTGLCDAAAAALPRGCY